MPSLILITAVERVTQIALIVLLAQVLNIEQLAAWYLFTGIASITVVIGSLGFPTFITNVLNKRSNEFPVELFVYSTIMCILGSIIFSRFVSFEIEYLLILTLYTISLSQISIIERFNHVNDQSFKTKLINVIFLNIIPIISIFLIPFTISAGDIILIRGISGIVGHAFIWPSNARLRYRSHTNDINFKSIGIFYFISCIAAINARSDIIFLEHYSSDAVVASYGVMVQLTTLITFAFNATIPAFIPKLKNESFAQGEKQFMMSYTYKMILICLIPFGIIVAFHDLILHSMMKLNEYSSEAVYLLAIGMLINVVFGPIGARLLSSNKHLKYLLFSLVSALSNIYLNYLLIPQFGENAAAFTTLLSFIIFNSLCFVAVKSMDHEQKPT